VFGRNNRPPSKARQVGDELVAGFDHLRSAAAQVAGGAADRLTPHYNGAKRSASRRLTSTRHALEPIRDRMRGSAAKIRRGRRRRSPILAILLAVGTAAGALGALLARRRRQALQWDEYDATADYTDADREYLPGDRSTGTNTVPGRAGGAATEARNTVAAGAARVADTVSARASHVADVLHARSGTGTPAGSPDTSSTPTGNTGTIGTAGSAGSSATEDNPGKR
jgi:hypothetical protein